MKNNFLLPLLAMSTISFASACSTKAGYEGVKEGARNHCRSQAASEVQACMDRLNTKTYEEYEKEIATKK